MSREKVLLPSLYEPSPSMKVQNINEYRIWEQGKKRAYRAELDKQLKERRRSREKSLEEKTIERLNLSTLVEEQKVKKANDKYAKIKTEQKYMEDNKKLMKKERIGSRLKQLWEENKEHPFVILMDEEEKRRKQTKSNFMFQNKINDVQNEMKKSIKKKRKEESVAEGKKYVNYVEAQFQKQMRQRMKFQQKYLKIDKDSIQSYKQQHLSFLKEQSDARYSQIAHKAESNRNKNNSMFGEHMPQTRKKSHKLSEDNRNRSRMLIDEEQSLRKQYDLKRDRNSHYNKVLTERAPQEIDPRLVTDRNRAQSSFVSSSNVIKYAQMGSSRPTRQYKHYDIIKNSQKVFFN